MTSTRCFCFVLIAAVFHAQNTPVVAGLFKMDFGELENFDDLEDWDVFETFLFQDFDDDIAVWPITDWSGGGDDDVILSIMDQEEIADDLGSFAVGMTANNPTHEQEDDVEYDGILIPFEVKDDYLYRNPDTAGTELLFRFDNLDPGEYNVTLFEGRTTDNNGQFAKIWVDDDISGGGEPDEENTDDFSGTLPDVDPFGHPQTIPVEIKAGQFLWYAHMEDNSGGISGIIIRQTSSGGPEGDFNESGVLDVEDLNLLTAEVIANTNPLNMDLNGDALVNQADRNVWVKDLKKTWFGDANLDGEFSSTDLVVVFQAGKFESPREALWQEGDWDGDGRFTSTDFVIAFQDGGFEMGPIQLASVPEPLTSPLALLAAIALFMHRRPRAW